MFDESFPAEGAGLRRCVPNQNWRPLPIDAGKEVRVIRLDVGRLVVTSIRENKQNTAPMSHGTGLDRPISEFDLDSIDS